MINIDSDGVLVDIISYFEKHWCGGKSMQTVNKLPEDERKAWHHNVYHQDPNMFRKLQPLKGARELIEKIRNSGVEWRVLTHLCHDHPDNSMVVADKIACLGEHFGIEPERIVTVPYYESKSQYLLTATDVLIDDWDRNIDEWTNKGGIGFLYTPEQAEHIAQRAIEVGF